MGIINLKRWAAVFGVLTLIAAVAATQLSIRAGDLSLKSWLQLFIVQVIIWNVWGLITPVIFNLSSHLSLRKSKIVSILIHIPASIVTVVLFLSLYAIIFLSLNGAGLSTFASVLKALIVSSFHWFMILYWITVGIEYYLRVLDRFKFQEVVNLQLSGQLAQAQLKALKMQLNPHFLFNSLNAISSLVRTKDNKKAVAMLAKLSDFLREVLIDREAQQIYVSEEISFVKKYLEIEQMRFGNKLKVNFEIEHEAEQCLVPSLVLQPIVENAIKHGISKKKDATNLSINILKVGNNLFLSVYNDGPSLRASHKLPEDQSGVGITNTLKRLKQCFGHHYKFTMENKNQGVEVKFQIPIQNQTDTHFA